VPDLAGASTDRSTHLSPAREGSSDLIIVRNGTATPSPRGKDIEDSEEGGLTGSDRLGKHAVTGIGRSAGWRIVGEEDDEHTYQVAFNGMFFPHSIPFPAVKPIPTATTHNDMLSLIQKMDVYRLESLHW
jgi:hypothetical protein